MNDAAKEYRAWLASLMGKDFTPHHWQEQLALEPNCVDRLIRIPTGFGKTLGVLLAWAFNRLHKGDQAWPRRLIWCLPMRVLVEQTEAKMASILERLGILCRAGDSSVGKVAIHRLLGGAGGADFHLWPEECSVLVGTQDMLLSRALNRGYAAARARWPMEFGLLNQDALWVMDEVQLMDVGLATSAQLQAFRLQDQKKPACRAPACCSWWMSATLQDGWLKTVDTETMISELPPAVQIPKSKQQGGLWSVKKILGWHGVDSDKNLAREVAELATTKHKPGTLTLVILNRVDLATAAFKELKGAKPKAELRLVHSRFRPKERSSWRSDFLARGASMPAEGRIVVATQVVEAGVDVSARTLITDLAPWSSLVQRFGRCARYEGEKGDIVVLDRAWNDAKDETRALPYDVSELVEARNQLQTLKDVSPRSLEESERELSSELRSRLYPYKPKHVLLRREWLELFDTTPDLTGADLDIGRFIRSGEDLDVQVFWRDMSATNLSADLKPYRDELCAVPFRAAQDWLCGKETKEKRAPNLKPSMRAWVWDWLDGEWKKKVQRSDLLPGRIVLVDASCGGYSTEFGWDPESEAVDPVPSTSTLPAEDLADDAQDNEELSLACWKTIGTHGIEARQQIREICKKLAVTRDMQKLLELAAEAHDIGKASPFFQGSIHHAKRPARRDLAKAPKDAWPRSYLYRDEAGEQRPGYRHELGSALALFDVLSRCAPDHPALVGEHAELLGINLAKRQGVPAIGNLEKQVVALTSRRSFDLVAYLVAAHHGKVRLSIQAAPKDQDYSPKLGDTRGLPIRGVREGDELPELRNVSGELLVAASTLTLEPALVGLSELTGPSWSERTLKLLDEYGPACLAWLEALIRAADIRASRSTESDPVLAAEGAK